MRKDIYVVILFNPLWGWEFDAS